MKKKLVTLVMATAVCTCALMACAPKEQTAGDNTLAQGDAKDTGSEEEPQEELTEDEQAAKAVADMIDAIYVQDYTEETDEQCRQAKEAWDNLTTEQQQMVEGEFADPDYFGIDTGNALLDDPRNGDEIGENEILVVSFGTSFNSSRISDIKGVEDAIANAYPDWSVRRAFTAQIIINHVQARDGEKIDNMDQALERAVSNGVKNLLVQPTHLMHGAEYDELCEAVGRYEDKFETVKIAEPLLGAVGADATEINDDKTKVAEYVLDAAVTASSYEDVDKAAEDGTAFIFLGHGTSHAARVTYDQMQTAFASLGHENVFVGTVEGEPEDTEIGNITDRIKEAGYSKIIIRPLMVVAGDHANNDMAGDDEDSWKSILTEAGFEVDCQIEGLGGIPEVQQLYIEHTGEAMNN